jgi:ABC-2 type transport system ATP-binding protein
MIARFHPPLPPVNNPIVEIAGLTKVYRGMERPALDDLSVTIGHGAFFGLLGPNGAGKSTLLSILSGLRAPTRGQVRIEGRDVVTDPQPVKAVLGLVPQDLALYPTLTARENLGFFGRMQGLSGARLRSRVAACLALAGLEGFADRRAETFSGGLKRRLNLVIGLIHEPRLLILDEPTVGIDPQSRHFIHESLRSLHADGMTILYSTHYMEEAEQLCDDIAIIDHGRILARGSVPALLSAHRDGNIEAHFESDLPPSVAEALRALPQVHARHIEARSFVLRSHNPEQTVAAVLAMLEREHVAVASLSMGAGNLEQVFLNLTGTRLRD